MTDINRKFWNFLNKNGTNLDKDDMENIYFILARSYFDNETIKKYASINSNESLELLFSKIDKDYNDIIAEIRENFSPNELKNIISDDSFLKELVTRRSFNLYMDAKLAKLLIELLDIKKGDNIYNPFSNYGEIINSILINSKDIKIEGLEINSYNRNISIIRNSSISNKFNILSRFPDNSNISNKLITMPPAGAREFYKEVVEKSPTLQEWIQKNSITQYSDLIYVIKNILDLENLERAVYLYPTGRLFNHQEKDILKFLVDNKMIEGIIQLPERLFYRTGISFSAFIISKNNESIKFVDARNEFKEDRLCRVLTDENIKKILGEYQNPNDIAREFTIHEIKSNNYLMLPSRLVVPDDQKIDDYYLLKDISDIQRGIGTIKKDELVKRTSSLNTPIKYMQANDFSYSIDYSKLKSLNEVKENEYRYLANESDIVISKIQNFNSMIFEDLEDYKIIISGNLYKIQIKSESQVNPFYVQAYLETDHAKEQISRLVSGTNTLIMPISTLRELKIPKLDKEVEEIIANKYKNILRRMRIVNQQIKSLEEDKNIIFDGVI